jgi:hypothetical protein
VWNTNPFTRFSLTSQVLRLAVAELPARIGEPIRHPDLLAMTVAGETVRLLVDAVGDGFPRLGPILRRKSTTYFLLT